MITILFAPPRTGKTCLLTHLLTKAAFNRERFLSMRREILLKNATGHNLSVPQHPVSANYDLKMRCFGYSPRVNRRINPYRLGFSNPDVETHFNVPFEVIGITEAQKYLNSRMSAFYPSWQSRWYEQHGHNNLEIILDVQRPGLIDVNIRELAQFIEIVKLDVKYDEFGKPCRLRWELRRMDNMGAYDKYISSGKKDVTCYDEAEEVAEYNVFACYDSQSCKPKFYEGHFGDDFDYELAQAPEDSLEGYVEYLERVDDELPKGFYKKKDKCDGF